MAANTWRQTIKLHLIRHGQTDWNAERRVQGQSESELDSRGQQQAEDLRPLIESLGIGSVYSSPSERTRQTTAILTTNIDLPVTCLDGLREIHLGPWETRLWQEIEQEDAERAGHFHSRPHQFQLDGAETFPILQQRGVTAVEHIMATEQVDDVLVVSHGALLKAMMVYYAGVDLSRLWHSPGLPNCSHSILETRADGRHELLSVAGLSAADYEW